MSRRHSGGKGGGGCDSGSACYDGGVGGQISFAVVVVTVAARVLPIVVVITIMIMVVVAAQRIGRGKGTKERRKIFSIDYDFLLHQTPEIRITFSGKVCQI
jgi:hypothetical protein